MATKKPLTFALPADETPAPAAPVVAPVEPAPAKTERGALKQVGARVSADNYRKLKSMAALTDTTVQALVEQAIADFIGAHEKF